MSKNFFNSAPSRSTVTTAVAILLAFPALAFAESPWEYAVRMLTESVTGPIARGLSLVAIVVGGLGYAFDGGTDHKRTMAGIILGCGMALGAASFVTWLFQ